MPKSLEEAFDLLDGHGDGCRIVAGATDVLPWARDGRAGDVHYPAVIDVSRVAELSGVAVQDGRVRMGGNVTFQSFLGDPVLRDAVPIMRHVAVWFADDQIRELATLAGNIINASPAADGTPPMIALNGTVTLESRRRGKRHAREMAVADFVTGPAATRLEPGEILTAIECDAIPDYGTAFEKVGHRRSLVISTVCVAALVNLTEDQSRFRDVRLALAAVGPVPVRLTEAEAYLKDRPVSPEVIREAALLPLKYVQSRTRREYRREVLVNFLERALIDALAELGVEAVAREAQLRRVGHG